MKKNHRFFLFIIILVTLAALTACGPAQTEQSQPIPEQVGTGVEQDKTYLPLVGAPEASEGSQPSTEDESSGMADTDECLQETNHSIAQNIAETYNISYQQVMQWYCGGYSFDNILVALETSSATDISADTLLEMLLEKDWEEIWAEIGFVQDDK